MDFLRLSLRHKYKLGFAFLLAVMIGVNALAYLHAGAMTHFIQGGARTARPESLSPLGKLGVMLTGVSLPRPENETTPAGRGVPFETFLISEPDGTVLEAWDLPGAGADVVVCFHAYGGCKSTQLDEAVRFRAMGFEVVLVDFRGSGGSSGSVTTIGVREADDVLAALDDVRRRHPGRRVFLFGQSMGSAAILRAVNGLPPENHPAGLILECPFDRLLTTVRHRFDAMRVPSFPLAELLVFWGGVRHGFDGFAHNPAGYAAGVGCPVFLMGGEDDPRVRPAELRAVFDRLRGPKTLHLFPGVRHESYAAARPDEWGELVSHFVRQVRKPPRP